MLTTFGEIQIFWPAYDPLDFSSLNNAVKSEKYLPKSRHIRELPCGSCAKEKRGEFGSLGYRETGLSGPRPGV